MTIYELGELCTWARGFQVPRKDTSVEKDIAYLHYGDLYKLYDYRMNLKDELAEMIKIDEQSKIRPEQYLSDGDIVFALTSETVEDLGHCTLILNPEEIPLVSGMETTAIHIHNKEKVNPSYLNYYFHTSIFQRSLQQYVTGMKVYRVHPKDLMKIEVDVPEKEIQDRVVQILDSIMDKIDLNSRINDTLSAIIREIFVETIHASETHAVKFGSLVSIGSGGTPRTTVAEYWGGEIPFFSPKDVDGIYVYSTEKNITRTGLDNCNSGYYPKNTTFITARGTVGNIALAAVEMAMNQSCFAITSKNPKHKHYIHQLSQYIVKSLKQKSNGAVFDAINSKDIEDELVPDVNQNRIDQFERAVTPIYEMIWRNGQETQELADLRDYLLPKLLSGYIEV